MHDGGGVKVVVRGPVLVRYESSVTSFALVDATTTRSARAARSEKSGKPVMIVTKRCNWQFLKVVRFLRKKTGKGKERRKKERKKRRR